MQTKYYAYYTFLGLFSTMILASLFKHLFMYEQMVLEYAKLGYPEHLIQPLAIAQDKRRISKRKTEEDYAMVA